MAYFNNTDRRNFTALGAGGLVSQSPPDATDDGSWSGDPANQAMSAQIWALKNSTAYLDRLVASWSFRMNDATNPNYSANPLGANYGVNKNAVLRRTNCIPFQAGFAYITGQRVSSGGSNYESLNDHTSAVDFATDAANWSLITGVSETPECRVQYTTYAQAIAATRATLAFLVGNAATGTNGYEDLCTAAGLSFYSAAAAESGVDSIFTEYPLQLEPTQVGLPSGVGFAVVQDTVIFLHATLADVWSAWANGGSNTVGQIKKDADLNDFWWCATANTSAASGTFAADRAGSAAGKWRSINVGVTHDHECSDRRPPTIADDPSSGGSLQFQMEAIGPMVRDKGYKLAMYTNDVDVANNVAFNNGITESSSPYILENVDQVQSVTDGNNYRGSNFFANYVANYNRWRYTNQDPAQGQRASWSLSKGAATIEMVQRYGNQAWAINNVAVGAGPTYTVTITAPNHNFPTGQYVDILGLGGMGITPGAYRVTFPNVGGNGRFVISTRVVSVDPWTGTLTTAAFNGQNLSAYTGGGGAMTGGSTFKDIIKVRRFARAQKIPNINMWRNFAEQGADELDGPSFQISGITNTNPAVVTTSSAHGLVSTTFDVRVTHDAINGMTSLNGLSLPVTVLTPTTYSIDNFNSTSLPAYTSGGIGQATRRMFFNRKINILAFNRGTPKMFL